MKRGLALFLAALLTVLTACGGGSGGGSESSSPMNSAAASEEDWGFYDSAEAPTETDAQTSGRLANAKMVYTASVEAETMDFDACTAGLDALTVRLGGYMEYASSGSYSDGRRSASCTVRIPAAQFDGFLKSVGELSHVTSQDKSAENISEQYYDTESRLVTQKTKLERLQTLLSRAESMEDVITLESAIAETELQIEHLTGSLRHYDMLVDYATVQIHLREVSRLSTVEEAPPTFASQLSNAFTGGMRAFGDFLQGLAIFAAYNWTWLLLLGLTAFLAVRVSRRKHAAAAFRGAREPAFFRRTEKDGPKKPDDKQPKD